MAFNLIIPQSNPIDPSGRLSREWLQFFILMGNAITAAVAASGASGSVQFNTAGSFASNAGFTYNTLTNTVGFGGILGTAAVLAIQPQALGTTVLKTGIGTAALTVADNGSASEIGLYGTTPAVQPTTAGAAAAFVVSAGTAVNDASTFDGYTLKQVVKALRNIGALA